MSNIKRPPEYQQQNGPYYDRLDYCLADDVRQYAEDMEAEINRLRKALQECMEEIDIYIDADYPIGAHPLYAKKNKWAKEANPARVALSQGEKV